MSKQKKPSPKGGHGVGPIDRAARELGYGDPLDDAITPADLVAAIATESAETIKLLTMLRVFCNLEQRDMDGGEVDGTLADAAEGLSVLMGDLADRVESIQNKVDQLYAVWPGKAVDGGVQ